MSLLMAATTVFGSSTPKNEANYDKVIQDFIESHLFTNYKKLATALNDEASFKIPRQEEVIVQDRLNLIYQMKQNAGALQNCESRYEVLSKSDAIVIARVDFQYPDFTQHNYIILEKNRDKEWKITQVYKMTEDDTEPEPAIHVIAKI